MAREKAMTFGSIADMKRQVTESGSFWFSKGAMEFFGTRLLGLRGGRFLITEETKRPYPEKFRVMYFRRVDGEPRLDHVTVGWYLTLEHARVAASGMARGDL